MKKTVAALLCAMLSFSSIPKISAFDAAQIDYDDIILTLEDDGTLTVSGTGVIESGYTNWAGTKRTKVKRIVIEDGVTGIGERAFELFDTVESIEIPNTVTSIGERAFESCTALTAITIPESVTSIGWAAFSSCWELTSVTFPDTLTEIQDYAFQGCIALPSVTIPDSVQKISTCAFADCTALAEVNLPKTLTDFNRFSFQRTAWYEALKENADNDLVIVNGVLLEFTSFLPSEVVIPETVTHIGYCAFAKRYLTSVTIPETVVSIEDEAFANTDLEQITIPGSVKHIGVSAFFECKGLTLVELSEGTESIGSSAFAYCHLLSDINIPSSVHTIGSTAFSHCYSLGEAFTIPYTVTTIGDSVFADTDTNTIKGYEGTAAEEFAKLENLTFQSIGKMPAFIRGDANGDFRFSIADAVTLQNWLLGVNDNLIADMRAIDYDENDKLDASDLTLMKRALLNPPPTAEN